MFAQQPGQIVDWLSPREAGPELCLKDQPFLAVGVDANDVGYGLIAANYLRSEEEVGR